MRGADVALLKALKIQVESNSLVPVTKAKVTLESLGPRGDGFHADTESIVSASIEPRLYLVARMLIAVGKK